MSIFLYKYPTNILMNNCVFSGGSARKHNRRAEKTVGATVIRDERRQSSEFGDCPTGGIETPDGWTKQANHYPEDGWLPEAAGKRRSH